MKKGFTLIELLVAMALLMMIVVSISKAFQHSTIAWDTGWRKVESIMVGRAVTDYVVRELQKCVYDPNGSVRLSGSAGLDDPENDSTFWIHDGTNGLYEVRYRVQGDNLDRVISEGVGRMFKGNDKIEVQNFTLTFLPDETAPDYAELSFDVWSVDKGIENTMNFKTRSPLMNRYRYYHEPSYQ